MYKIDPPRFRNIINYFHWFPRSCVGVKIHSLPQNCIPYQHSHKSAFYFTGSHAPMHLLTSSHAPAFHSTYSHAPAFHFTGSYDPTHLLTGSHTPAFHSTHSHAPAFHINTPTIPNSISLVPTILSTSSLVLMLQHSIPLTPTLLHSISLVPTILSTSSLVFTLLHSIPLAPTRPFASSLTPTLLRGRKNNYNTHMPRSRYRVYEQHSPHFLTCTVVNWLPLFNDPNLIGILYDSLHYMQKHDRLTIYAYVIMDTHLHLVAASENLSKEIANLKSFTARRIIDTLKENNEIIMLEQLARAKARHKTDRQFKVWQEGSHPQVIQNEAMMRQKIEYIHHNPVKRGLVDYPVQWKYSSAANYSVLPGLLDVEQNW